MLQKWIEKRKKTLERLLFPVALVLAVIYSLVSYLFGIFTFTWEKVGKAFIAFVVFIMLVGFIYIFFGIVFPLQNRYFDPSFKENEKWNLLTEKEKFDYSFKLFVALLFTLAAVLLSV